MKNNTLAIGILSFTILVLAGYIAFGTQRNSYVVPGKNGQDVEAVRDSYIAPQATTTSPAQKKAAVTPTPIKCVRGGCSSELCLSEKEASQGGASVCWYKEEFACYASARCEQQSNGTCGWTQTSELKQCIASKDAQNKAY